MKKKIFYLMALVLTTVGFTACNSDDEKDPVTVNFSQAKYTVEGKRVKIAIKGTADASPIARAIAYDGRYGEYDQEPVYKDGELNNVSLNKKEGIGTNDQLAFARAIGVQNYMEKELSSFEKMNRDYEYHIEVSKEEGSKYRRISVHCTFIDAF